MDHEDGVSGNTFRGPASFQVGDHNVQNIHFHQPGPRHGPLVLAGAAHTTREELAAAIRGDWETARRQFFERPATASEPSEGLLDLLSWLRGIDGLTVDDLSARIVLIDHRLRDDSLSPDLKLLHLLCWLAPEGEPVWRGAEVTLESLSEACRIGRLEESGPERELYCDVCRGGLLDAFSGFAALSTLRGTQHAWDEVWDSWLRLVARVPELPRDAQEWAEGSARGLLLAALLPHPGTQKWLRTARERVTPPATGVVEWYDRLRAQDGGPDTPTGWLVRTDFAAFASVQAKQQAQQAARDRENQRTWAMLDAASALRDRQWADYETRRLSLAARLGAVVRATLWVGAWGAATVLVAWLVWGWAFPAIARTMSWYLVALTLGAYAGRLPGVVRLGAAYQPPLRHLHRWAKMDRTSIRRGLIRVGVVVGVVLFVGVMLHDTGTLLTTAFVAVLLISVYRAARSSLHDWDDEHRRRLRDYAARRADPRAGLGGIARDVRSPSARVRADGYHALLRQFTGLEHGADDRAGRKNDH